MRVESNEMTELLKRLRTGKITKSQLFEQIPKLHPTAINSEPRVDKTNDLLRPPISEETTPLGSGRVLSYLSTSGPSPKLSTVFTSSFLPEETLCEKKDCSASLCENAESTLFTYRDTTQDRSIGFHDPQQVPDIPKPGTSTKLKNYGKPGANNMRICSLNSVSANADEVDTTASQNCHSNNAISSSTKDLYHIEQNQANHKELSGDIPYAYRPSSIDENNVFCTEESSNQSYGEFTRMNRIQPFQESLSFPTAARLRIGDGGFNPDDSLKREKEHKSNIDFLSRITSWVARKDAQQQQIKQQLLLAELKDCSFSPQLNAKSMKFAELSRIRKGFVTNTANSTASHAASERLHHQKCRNKEREELIARFMDEQEAILRRECTFQPRINMSCTVSTKIRSKYMEKTVPSPATHAAHVQASEYELKECTFQPKVNTISPSMISAHLYLKQNIFERLSRMESQKKSIILTDSKNDVEIYPSNQNDSDPSAHYRNKQDGFDAVARELGGPEYENGSSSNGYISGSLRNSNTIYSAHNRSAKNVRPHSAGKIFTNEKEQDQRFRNFIERQHFYEQTKNLRLEKLKHKKKSEHKFSMNKCSAKMMANGRKGEFLERVTKDLITREREAIKKNYLSYADPHCTFQPKINQKSARRKARSIMELSRGDLLRRETTKRLVKIQVEQDEMARLTFHPHLNRVSNKAHSKLKIMKSPETYLQRVKQQMDFRETRQRNAAVEKETEELSKCTFRPSTIEAPAYVHHIARSVSLRKRLRQQMDNQRRKESKDHWK
uniref:Uncharacterized protein AlNc14C39G3387 n=1 Tax=Albugo laibachii Nc14 TaxID=890382 RepID=F0W9C0_9STRA|nr:conserved hypothetical protein [Albugo laibachii Nc14]CCA18379.1 conserved hypothetical protein [Albugo laibachii Nc14]|eukprot:CCA18379.1 conserved hypothetical protein [Albugo laibachii Nc14]